MNMEKKLNKKQTILKMFEEAEWLPHHDYRIKIISGETFESNGLYHAVENASQHCDVLYARRIIQKLGYTVLIGSCLYVYDYSKQGK